MGGFALAGYAARTLRGHYEGTKIRLGHYRGQQISTGGNGKSMENALVSAESKRVEKAFLHFGKEEVTSSNLVNSSKSLHVAPAVCRDCVLFGFGENRDSSPKRRGAVYTVLYSGYNRYNRNRPEVQQLRRRFPGFCLRTADTAAGR